MYMLFNLGKEHSRDWLQVLKLDWKEIQTLQVSKSHLDVLQKHSTVFKSELGEIRGVEGIPVDSKALPKFHKARSVPYVLKDKIE